MCFKHIRDSDYSKPEPEEKNTIKKMSQTCLEGKLFLKPHCVITCKQGRNVLQLNWSVSISRVARGNGEFFDRMNKILQKQDILLSADQTEVYNHIHQKIASLLLPRCIPVTTFPRVLKNQVILKQFFLLSIAVGFSNHRNAPSLFPSYKDSVRVNVLELDIYRRAFLCYCSSSKCWKGQPSMLAE